MNYVAHTDGSCKKDIGRAASAYIIVTKDKLIHNDVYVLSTIYILDAELYAIVKVLECFATMVDLKEGDRVVIKVDSMYAIKLCRNILCDRETLEYNAYSNDIKKYISIIKSKKVWIEFKKVRAHVNKMNMNKFVDRLAKCGVKNYEMLMR